MTLHEELHKIFKEQIANNEVKIKQGKDGTHLLKIDHGNLKTVARRNFVIPAMVERYFEQHKLDPSDYESAHDVYTKLVRHLQQKLLKKIVGRIQVAYQFDGKFGYPASSTITIKHEEDAKEHSEESLPPDEEKAVKKFLKELKPEDFL